MAASYLRPVTVVCVTHLPASPCLMKPGGLLLAACVLTVKQSSRYLLPDVISTAPDSGGSPSPRKPGRHTRFINVQRKRPAIALTQPLHDTQTQTIPLRR